MTAVNVPWYAWMIRESDLLFASWRVDPRAIRPYVPWALDLDLYDHSAWLTVEALRIDGHPAWLPRPAPPSGVEVNVRTYVRYRDEPGIYMLSMDSPQLHLVERLLWRLPFRRARGKIDLQQNRYAVTSARSLSSVPAEFAATGDVSGPPAQPLPGTADEFLLNRTILFLVGGPRQRIVRRGEVPHPPRSVQRFQGSIQIDSIVNALGARGSQAPPVPSTAAPYVATTPCGAGATTASTRR